MREQHTFTVARVNGRKYAINGALHCRPKYVVGGWLWVYNTDATLQQEQHKGTDNKVLQDKLSLN